VSYQKHLAKASDLITLPNDTRAGFIAMAVERSRRAVPYVSEARTLKMAASSAKTALDLLGMNEIRAGLVSAAGVSDKAKGHMQEDDKVQAISELIANHLDIAGNSFIEELVYRFLLTKGDSLGGSMRNVTGVLAERRVLRAIISSLNLAEVEYFWRHRANGTWISGTRDDVDIEVEIKSMAWHSKNGARVLLFNRNVPFIGRNVDMCLLESDPQTSEEAIRDAKSYVALGELKGGIDPAGADEHWKTAATALKRINKGFASDQKKPHTFFIGAAIVAGMADEIWEQLNTNTLANAANLTNPDQLASICSWLVGL